MSTDYTDYTAKTFNDPSYYGSGCTPEDADAICGRLAALIKHQFPGIDVAVWTETIGGTAGTSGPDQLVCADIDQWISDHWTAAL